jgi:predicted dithiol-disulfide oxidoreductase (DUF899 family)/uncharacterized protein YndB with AHSA1/START domain
MATTPSQPEPLSHRLQVRRTFDASPARLFHAWTTPEDLKRWYAPNDLTVALAQVDLRVGGQYRIHMRKPDGTEHRVTGRYEVIEPPHKLAFTWQWEGEGDPAETLVTVDFQARGTGTELVLTHERFATAKARDGHQQGWSAILEKLAAADLNPISTRPAGGTTADSIHSTRFPGENAEYRVARDKLLRAELDLRNQLEAVAALRRTLPLGGALKEDYLFDEGSPDLNDLDTMKPVRLSELFREGKDTLMLYSFMYGPAMQRPCTSCTSILDGLNGSMPHVVQRVNVAIVAKSPMLRIREFARERGWRNLRLLSSARNSYNSDYHGETLEGGQLPALNVFVRRHGRIHHFYSTELLYAPFNRGQDGRHVDLIWPVWNMFDLTPEGRGTDWYPRLAYDRA